MLVNDNEPRIALLGTFVLVLFCLVAWDLSFKSGERSRISFWLHKSKDWLAHRESWVFSYFQHKLLVTLKTKV